MIDRRGESCDRTSVLVAVLDELAELFDRLESDDFLLAPLFAQHCLLTGKVVTIRMPGREVVGVCRGIGGDGRLLVQTTTGLEPIAAGVVADW